MFKRLLLATVLATASAGAASAAPITGSFSLTSFGGSYMNGTTQTGTATTATGLDFGNVGGPAGNGYGTNGSALVGIATGSFASLNGTLASIADIALAAFANPYTVNPFVSFANSPLQLNFTNATYSVVDTSITVSGAANFTDGIDADTSTGMFSLSANSQGGNANSVNFTFTSNASVTSPTAVPEPGSLALLAVPAALAGMLVLRRRRDSMA